MNQKTLYKTIGISLLVFQVVMVVYMLFNRKRSSFATSHKLFVPHYFNETLSYADKGLAPPKEAFEKMLYLYQQYHQSVLDSYVFSGRNCFSNGVIQGHEKSPQFVVFKAHMYSGYGNIIMGLFSTLLYALLSNRVFLVNWNGGEVGCHASLSQLLKDPVLKSHSLMWNYADVKSKSIENGCPRERWESIERNWLHMESTVYHDRSKLSYRYFKCSKGFAQILPTYLSKENEKFNQINSKDFIEMEAAQYFAPSLYADNDVYYQLFSKFEKKNMDWELVPQLYRINIFEKLAPFLFKPIDTIQNKIDEYEKELFGEKLANPDSTFILGVQIRKNLQENLFHNTPVSIYWDCAKQRISALDTKKYKKVIIFLTSDYVPAYDEAKHVFSEMKIKGIEISLVHMPQNVPKSRSVESVQTALVDLYVMMKADDLIMSEKSTCKFIEIFDNIYKLVC
ncbi:predicted protein [Naegleria gruberi]|uniref:Predicted protein n=1 Tax=Naegleria gruberi TaxID=5762 RepID=D2VCY0_NAEGR|nr:uncharacterized protein NAEGRDRAFT_66728 [Naegleria gruberi]EFC45381.1 predicted protein [Naegleria gruberi]|eukprot:XP_002678125.1 predicted protein [Naegleria gruberi strain NEG-M]